MKIMKRNQIRNLVIILFVFLVIRFIFNGIQGNWSLIFLFKDTWIILLSLIVGFCLATYFFNKNKN